MFERLANFLDRIAFLNVQIWNFGYHSVFHEYAWLYLIHAAGAHPLRTWRGIRAYQRFIKISKRSLRRDYFHELSLTGPMIPPPSQKDHTGPPLLGLGFCLKPFDPSDRSNSCPSGRANHDCLYLEEGRTAPVCANCEILRLAEMSLDKGISVYVMTSAKDIAFDMLFPQLERGVYSRALLCLCPYSIQAILPSLFIGGMQTDLFAFDIGFCRNFNEWIRADRGDKSERTKLSPRMFERISDRLARFPSGKTKSGAFVRRGNIFFPVE